MIKHFYKNYHKNFYSNLNSLYIFMNLIYIRLIYYYPIKYNCYLLFFYFKFFKSFFSFFINVMNIIPYSFYMQKFWWRDLYFLLLSFILEISFETSLNILSYLIYYITIGNLSLDTSFDIISYLIYYSIIGN